jgi:hypothetical protein
LSPWGPQPPILGCQELDDPITLASCVISLVLNLVVTLQIALLGGPPKKGAGKAVVDRQKGKAE